MDTSIIKTSMYLWRVDLQCEQERVKISQSRASVGPYDRSASPGVRLCERQLPGPPPHHDQVRLVAELQAGECVCRGARHLDEHVLDAVVPLQPRAVRVRFILQAAELGIDALVADVDAAPEVPLLDRPKLVIKQGKTAGLARTCK